MGLTESICDGAQEPDKPDAGGPRVRTHSLETI